MGAKYAKKGGGAKRQKLRVAPEPRQLKERGHKSRKKKTERGGGEKREGPRKQTRSPLTKQSPEGSPDGTRSQSNDRSGKVISPEDRSRLSIEVKVMEEKRPPIFRDSDPPLELHWGDPTNRGLYPAKRIPERGWKREGRGLEQKYYEIESCAQLGLRKERPRGGGGENLQKMEQRRRTRSTD